MIIMRSEGKFLRHFKEAAPLAVSTFGSKIGHLTLRMILHSSSKKVGLVAHHYHHFVRARRHPVSPEASLLLDTTGIGGMPQYSHTEPCRCLIGRM